MNRIEEKFNELARQSTKGLFPFLVAGQVDLDTTAKLILRFQELGAAGLELGFPFTDPVADGPVIQSAFIEALAGGVTVRKIFHSLEQIQSDLTIPLVAMVSASIVYRVGIDRFLDEAKAAGFDGVLVPDLSFEEAPDLAEKVAKRDLHLPMLVAPTSPAHRQERIAATATGFLYYISVTGITGERDKLPDDLAGNVRRLKELSGKPVLVGFGIKDPSQVRLVCSVADGAIVGSSFVRRVGEAHHAGLDPDDIVDKVGGYLCELLEGLNGRAE